MTDKQYRAQKLRIQKLIDRWIEPLGLDWWEITFEYIRGTHDGSDTEYAPFTGKAERYTCIMEVSTDYFYKTANIRFFLETMQPYDDKAIERYFVHELMHIFLKPMQTKQHAKDEELVATHLANAVIWSRQEGEKTGGGKTN